MSTPINSPPKDGNIVKIGVGVIVVLLMVKACDLAVQKPAESTTDISSATSAAAVPESLQLPAITGETLSTEALKIESTLEAYKPPETAPATLTVRSWNWNEQYSYAIVEGTVKNNSAQPIRNLQAVVEFTDKSGNFITSGSALVEFRPLMPGQSSPFKVMESFNPMMKSANLRFKELMGGEIDFDQGARKDKRPTSPFAYNIQLNLLNLGFIDDAPDGVMGEGTRNAIRAFEKAYALPVTGQPSKFVYAATEVAYKRKRLPTK